MNKFLLHITSLVALVLFLTMSACNNTPKAPILLEAEKTIEKQPDSALNYLGRVNSDLQDALQAQEYYLKALAAYFSVMIFFSSAARLAYSSATSGKMTNGFVGSPPKFLMVFT